MTALILQHRRRRLKVSCFRDASEIYCNMRDNSGEGGSTWEDGRIFNDAGEQIAYVSYNGRVWSGSAKTWSSKELPLFCAAKVQA